ncbi:MAG: hypothetical protein ACREOH_13980, partial [Candidatus Entotheonellia bacterium]
MAEGKLSVGSVDVLALTDAEGDFPFPLSQLFPNVPPEAWAPYLLRRRGLSAFRRQRNSASRRLEVSPS